MRILCKLGFHSLEWTDYEWTNVFSVKELCRWGFKTRLVEFVWVHTHTRQKCCKCGHIENHLHKQRYEQLVKRAEQ